MKIIINLNALLRHFRAEKERERNQSSDVCLRRNVLTREVYVLYGRWLLQVLLFI